MAKKKFGPQEKDLHLDPNTFSEFERQLYMTVVQAGVYAMHAQAPIQRVAAMPTYFDSLANGSMRLASLFVNNHRKTMRETDAGN